MAKAVFFTLPHHGHINPNIGLLEELVRRGEAVLCYSSAKYKGIVEAAGARWREYRVDLEAFFFKKGEYGTDIPAQENEDIRFNIQKAFEDIEALFGVGRDIYLKHCKEILEYGADYFIYDSFAVWGKIFSDKLGIPAVCCESLFVMTEEIFNAHIEYFIVYLIKNKSLDSVTPAEKKLAADCMDYYSRRIQRKLAIRDFSFSGYFYSDYLNIVYLVKEMQPMSHCIGDKFALVGMDYNTGTDLQNKREENRTPLIFISRGTIHGSEAMEVFNKCISVLGGMDCRVIISTGGCTAGTQFKDLPSNIKVFDFVNQKQLLKEADIFITHGGLTGVREAIFNGVPMLLYPETTDQYIASRQIAQAGAGIWLKSKPFCCAELENAIEKILKTQEYRENVKLLKAGFESAGGYGRSVEKIFDFKKAVNIL
ncbi:4'-demethylrebeccamycin synthase [Ruminiclostridium hungatei]|uniref:4'-demethylrebeccamycin synthase n=1 Tax=Ruminiclostridium hungatei TaxID=48256 RepID=A0A1V4SPN1_RUMHU|nr:nucleotide disphospho-sugar-binding domain-containing protein [Ruminiclostridium hungatei]OPX45207.1 4'-demethylrebeccamycin synthase [Ruminiclostridium hungatei]